MCLFHVTDKGKYSLSQLHSDVPVGMLSVAGVLAVLALTAMIRTACY